MSDEWFVGTADSNEGQLLIRALTKLPADDVRAANPNLIIITWPYDGSVPDDETYEAIQQFEDVLFTAIEQGHWAVEAASLTGNGNKEWRLYTGDVEFFVAQFNEALLGQAVYPLDLQSFEDPEWAALSELQPG